DSIKSMASQSTSTTTAPAVAQSPQAIASSSKPELPTDAAAFVEFSNGILKEAPHSSRAKALRQLRDAVRNNRDADPPQITPSDALSIISILDSCRKIRQSYTTGGDERKGVILTL